MRVAVISKNFLPKIDGATRTLGRVLDHLQAYGHEAIVFGSQGSPRRYGPTPVSGCLARPQPFWSRPTLQYGQSRIHLVHVGAVVAYLPLWARTGPSVALHCDGEAVDLRDHACLL